MQVDQDKGNLLGGSFEGEEISTHLQSYEARHDDQEEYDREGHEEEKTVRSCCADEKGTDGKAKLEIVSLSLLKELEMEVLEVLV